MLSWYIYLDMSWILQTCMSNDFLVSFFTSQFTCSFSSHNTCNEILIFYCLHEFLCCPFLVSHCYCSNPSKSLPYCLFLSVKSTLMTAVRVIFKEKHPWLSIPFLIPLSVFPALLALNSLFRMAFKILHNLPPFLLLACYTQ